MSKEQYEVLWPRGEQRIKKTPLASRPDTLDGKRIAFVWDYLFRGDMVFSWLEDAIKARYPKAEFVHWREFGNTHGPNEREVVAALPERLKATKADVAISAMGC